MAKIIPFKALRFTEKAGEIGTLCCPPYDIISEDEQKALYEKSPYNVIRLELNADADRYGSAAETLKSWLGSGILKTDDIESLYIYEEEFSVPEGGRKALRTLIADIELTPFDEGVVLPHEETLSRAKADRLELMRATFCNFSLIYSLFIDADKRVGAILLDECKRAPDVEFSTPDGIVQRLWAMTDPQRIGGVRAAFSEKQVFIADGHHRYETAVNFRNELKEKGIIAEGADHPANYCMMAFVDIDDPGLVVLPTHRLIRGLPAFDKEDVREKLKADFEVFSDRPLAQLDADMAAQDKSKRFALYLGGGKYDLLVLKSPDAPAKRMPGKCPAYIDLDVAVLHSVILEPVFGIDRENMARQANLTYTRSVGEAVEGVDGGKFQCAFLLNPTRVSQIRDVAASGEKMPQKSTYFYPKLITGLVMNKLGDL